MAWKGVFSPARAMKPNIGEDGVNKKNKFGPTTRYWTEVVFEAYVNHQSDVIFLEGLPDIPESRPHSGVNDG
jgi:hypothetical protein